MTFVDHAPDKTPHGRWLGLVPFLVLTLGVGAVSGVATVHDVATWYPTLVKPSFNPPNGVFAPVWTTLYVLMAVAAWRVWRVAGAVSRPLLLFYVQLALNCAWSFLFFKDHRIAAALADIVVLFAMILATAISFGRRDRWAGLLFVPYLAWVGFATALNGAIWQLHGMRGI